MHAIIKRLKYTALSAALAVSVMAPVVAQETYPNKPITIVVPFPPGGGSDTLSRVVGQGLSKYLNVPVLVENKPGGNTVIAAQYVARAKPDGYTVLTAIDSTMVMNPALYSKLAYDPVKDFKPVTLATSMPMVIAVNPSFPARTLPELMDYLRANPDKANYAHGALPGKVVIELFKMQANVPMMPVPFNGSAASAQAVIGGHVPVLIDALSPALPHIRSGQLRALAVTTAARVPALPDVPSVSEFGITGVDASTWTGFFVPAGVDPEIVQKLHKGFAAVLSQPDVRKHFEGLGMSVVGLPAQDLGKIIKADSAKYKAVIDKAGIRID